MRRVLVVADLEGITGVDTIDDLLVSAPGYAAAAACMTDEVALVARLLRARGLDVVRVSDSHASGAAANIDPARLPDGCELRVEEHDPYGGALLDGVEAVCCVGMHALGASAGFGAHTVSLNTEWRLGSALLTETHLVRLLAAERGVPLWFVSGDDVLGGQLQLGEAFVETKRALSRGEARSLDRGEVQRRYEAVVARPPLEVSPVPRLPLTIRFQRVAEADAAEQAGGHRVSTTRVVVEPSERFSEQYLRALELTLAGGEACLPRVRGVPGTARFAINAARLLLEPWEDEA